MADEKAGRRVEAGDREPTAGESAWILGDQLDREAPALADARPGVTRILLVESRAAIEGRRWHRQRLHLVLAAMRRFARRLRDEGFEVDHRTAPTLAAGLAAHREAFRPARVRATEPMSWAAQARLRALGVELLRSDRFLCHHEDFARWADGRARLRMEDFYRWQRRRLGYLMDGDAPAGGRWNYDHDNREPRPGLQRGGPSHHGRRRTHSTPR